MNKMVIFDPAMCCSTGLCGVSVDPELLRIATVINKLKAYGVIVERYNPNSTPQAFLLNPSISQIINTKGIDALPITIINGNIVKMGSYLSNDEISSYFSLPEEFFKDINNEVKRKNISGKARRMKK